MLRHAACSSPKTFKPGQLVQTMAPAYQQNLAAAAKCSLKALARIQGVRGNTHSCTFVRLHAAVLHCLLVSFQTRLSF